MSSCLTQKNSGVHLTSIEGGLGSDTILRKRSPEVELAKSRIGLLSPAERLALTCVGDPLHTQAMKKVFGSSAVNAESATQRARFLRLVSNDPYFPSDVVVSRRVRHAMTEGVRSDIETPLTVLDWLLWGVVVTLAGIAIYMQVNDIHFSIWDYIVPR